MKIQSLFTPPAIALTLANLTIAETVGWSFATDLPSSPPVTNLTVGAVSQYNNNGTTNQLLTTTSASSGYTGATGTYNAGLAARTGGLNTEPGYSAAFQFALTPAAGYKFTLTGISFGTRSTSTGPQAYALRSSADGYAADIATGTIANNSSWPLKSNTGLALVGTAPITFRLFGYNGTGSPGTNTTNWRIDDLALTVTVESNTGDVTPPAVFSYSPLDNAPNVPVGENLKLTFNEAIQLVQPASGNVTIKKSSDNSTVETIPAAALGADGATVTINPAADLPPATGLYVLIDPGVIEDSAGNDYAGIADTTTWNFTTAANFAPGAVAINEVLGDTTATDTEFIELFNTTGSEIDLSGWVIEIYESDAGASFGTLDQSIVIPAGKTIPAGGRYLLGSPAFATAYPLVTPDQSFPNDTLENSSYTMILRFATTRVFSAFVTDGGAGDAANVASQAITPDVAVGPAPRGMPAGFALLPDGGPQAGLLEWSPLPAPSATPGAANPPPVAGTLTVSVEPASFLENAGAAAALGTVTRSGPTTNALTVALASSDTSEATVPASVEIPAGEASASFAVAAVDDFLVDGDVVVTTTASAFGYPPGTFNMTVLNDADLPPFTDLVINEVDCDQTGTDIKEFVELYNKSTSPQSLNGLVLVLFNGTDDTAYRAVDLSSQTIPANGFFVIGSSAVPNVNLEVLGDGWLQNGPGDAVALYAGSPADFPNGTPVGSVTKQLIDAVVCFGTDPGLIAALTPGKPATDEDANAASETESVSRLPDGGDAFDTTTYATKKPTPGATNVAVPTPFESWIAPYTSTLGGLTGFYDDPDFDGSTNGIEWYFHNGDPSVGNAYPSAATATGSAAPGSFTFTHRRPVNRTGVLETYQWTTDLLFWLDSGQSDFGLVVTVTPGTPSPDPANPGFEIVTVTAEVTAGSLPGGYFFVRLKVEEL